MATDYLHLIKPLIRGLMEKEISRLHKIMTQLVVENHVLGGHKYGFYYFGVLYSPYERRYTASQSLKAIHQSLTHQAHALYTASLKRQSDEQKLRQTLSVLLSRCNTRQDVRDALPEILGKLVNDLRTLPRSRPEGFVLNKTPHLREQYNTALEIVNFYTFNKMVY